MILARGVRRLYLIVGFALFFLKELVVANLRVAREVAEVHRDTFHPGIVAYPMEARSNFEIALFANLICLTPGTTAIDVTPDRKILYIHEMYLGEIDHIRDFERRLLRAIR